MRRILVTIGLLGFLLPTTGCLFTSSKPGQSRSAVQSKKSKDCKPSQYWDGSKCRHKGKGKGARKHDD